MLQSGDCFARILSAYWQHLVLQHADMRLIAFYEVRDDGIGRSAVAAGELFTSQKQAGKQRHVLQYLVRYNIALRWGL